jgi:PPOX class probable FMN-dependent enzyme
MAYEVEPQHAVTDEAALRALFEPVHTLAVTKQQGRLGPHAQAFIRRSPFLCIGTQTPDGRADVSPRGDAPGFVRILDETTLAIPDRPGNNRLDTLSNIVANPAVGLLFIVPGFDDTLRIAGTAQLSTAPELLAGFAVNARTPSIAIVVRVDEVFLHCAKAFRRSRLWDPASRQDRTTMPSLVQMILEETGGAVSADEQARKDADLEADYRRTLY